MELHIVFDGPPGHEAGRFVECETPDGRSVNAGEWHERGDGFWELRLNQPVTRPTADLGEDGELVEALGDVLDIIAAAQAEFSRTDEHKAYYNKRHDQVQQARDRLILYREALEEIANPLAAMQRRAAAEGNRLSGMANQIANDPEQLKQIARAVLSRSGL